MTVDRKKGVKRSKKRRFQGNQFSPGQSTVKKVCVESASASHVSADVSVQNKDSPEKASEFLNSNVDATPTSSEKKLKFMYRVMSEIKDDEPETDNEADDVSLTVGTEGNRIIDLAILSENISSKLCCKFCSSNVTLIEVKRQGFDSELAFHCSNRRCNDQESFHTAPQVNIGSNLHVSSINRRSVLAMRAVGGDRSELATFAGIMDLPPPVQKSSYSLINKTIEKAATETQTESMQTAAHLEYSMAMPVEGSEFRNIDVSSDGTWMTVGHSSNVGVATTIGCTTGKVLDTGTRSKVCKSCDVWEKRDKTSPTYIRWRAQHVCTANHEGSSGGMEGAIITEIFCRSEQLYKLRYTRFIGDGDTNTFKVVSEAKPYGDDVTIEKIECVGHVQKRMGTRLRKLKQSMKGQRLADGKTLFGKGRLTDSQIDKIQRQYGIAIRANKKNLVKMRENVWAVYFHKLSTDDNPLHNFCTANCPYKKAEAQNQQHLYKHKNSLPSAVMEAIKPVFKDLAKTDLLKKCLEGYSQNPNESINSIIWKICPKKKNHGLCTVNISVALAVGLFNDGAVMYAKVMEKVGLKVGRFAAACFTRIDSERICNAQNQAQAASHEARIARRQGRLARDERQAAEEGQPYLAGGH